MIRVIWWQMSGGAQRDFLRINTFYTTTIAAVTVLSVAVASTAAAGIWRSCGPSRNNIDKVALFTVAFAGVSGLCASLAFGSRFVALPI